MDSPSGSRPVSRAQSDATERPDSSHSFAAGGTRSLGREIDHIKSLISHSQAAPPRPESMITAQVFRQRSSSSADKHVPTARIFQELDSLKKRLKLEMAQLQQQAQQNALARRTSVSRDPDETETESESEGPEVPDEREEELERAREELAVERQNREKWLGNAEDRIDRLLSEKEALVEELRTVKLGEAKSRVNAQARSQGQDSQLKEVQMLLEGMKKECEEQRITSRETLSALEKERSEKAEVVQKLVSTQTSLNNVNEQSDDIKTQHASQISALQEETTITAGKLQRALDEQSASHEYATEELAKIQKQHHESNYRVQDLERQLVHTETAAAELRREHESHSNNLAAEIKLHKSSLEKASQDVHSHEQEMKQVVNDRDNAQARIETLVKEHQASLDGILAETDVRAKEVAAEHESTRRILQGALDESNAGHGKEMDALRVQHDLHIRDLTATHESAQKMAEASLQDAKRGRSEEIESLLLEREQYIKSLTVDHTSALKRLQDSLEEARAVHSSQLGDLRTTHGHQLKVVSDELATAKAGAEESHAASQTKLADLAGQLATESGEVKSLREQLQQSEESRGQRVQDLEKRSADSQARFAELEAEAKAKNTELAAEITATNDELAAVLESKTKADSQINQLEKAQTEIGEQLKEAQAKCDELTESHDKAVADLKSQHGRELDDRNASHAIETVRLQAGASEAAERHATASSELESAHREVVDEHSREVDALRAEARRTVDGHLAAVAELQNAHQKALDDAVEQRKGQVAQLQTQIEVTQAEYLATNEKVSREHQTALADLVARHRNDLDSSDSDAKKQLGDIRSENAFELAALREEHREAFEKLGGSHAAALSELTAKHQSASGQNKADAERLLVGLKTDHASELRRLHKQHADAQETHQTELQRRADEATQVHESLEKQLSERQAAHDAEVSALEVQSASKAAELERQTDRLQETFGEQLADLKIKHNLERERVVAEHEAELRKARDELQESMHTAHAGHEKVVEELKGQHAAVIAEHEAERQKTRDEHQASMQTTHASHEKVLEELKGQHADALAEHERTLQEKHTDHQTEVEWLRTVHVGQLETARSASDSSSFEIQQNHAAVLRESQASHSRELEETRLKHGEALEIARKEHRDAVWRVQQEHESRLKAVSADLNRTQQHTQRLEAQLIEADAVSAAARASLEAHHGQTMEASEAAKLADIQQLRQDHEVSMAALRERLETELGATRELHEQKVQETQVAIESRIDEIRASHVKSIAERDEEWIAKVLEIREQHSKSISDAMRNSDAGTSQTLKDLQEQRADALQKALDHAQLETDQRVSAADLQHQQALEKALQEARDAGRSEVDALRGSHEEALQSLLKEAEEQTHDQLLDMEENHRVALNAAVADANNGWEETLERQTALHSEEIAHLHTTLTTELNVLQIELEKAADLRQHEMRRVETQNHGSFAELTGNLAAAEKKSTDMLYKQEEMGAEIAALRARLDAELTAHAEAERALAKMQKQRADEDKYANESKDALVNELVHLRQEKENISSQHAQVSTSLRELRRKSQIGSSPITPRTSDQLIESQMRVAAVESERDEAHNSCMQALRERTALAHQNDFLVKELEALMAQLGAPKATKATRADAEVQTEVSLPGTPRANGKRSLGEPFDARHEPKSDVASMLSVKGKHRAMQRPSTPSSPLRRVTASENVRHWRTGSFEDYLLQAKTELSELGSVITANETLFAQKIEEHIGDLQHVKDQLADEYKEKLDVLLAEKEDMQQDAASRGAAEFARERQKLVATYGVDLDEPNAQAAMLTSLPLYKAVALRTAEERLVYEYNRRIARRKSQIALKHAEEYQKLTQEYDCKIAELLRDRERLEGDLSVEPVKFEQDTDELMARSLQLEAEKEQSAQSSPLLETAEAVALPKIEQKGIPRRVLTSTPRTPTSIPRASSIPRTAPYPSGKPSSSADTASQASIKSPRDISSDLRTASDKHVPIPQRSLLRVKSPPEVPLHRSVSNPPLTSEKSASPSSAADNQAQDLGIAANQFEKQASYLPKVVTTEPVGRSVSTSKRTAEPRAAEDRGRLLRKGAVLQPAAAVVRSAPKTAEKKHAGGLKERALRHSSESIYRHQPRQASTQG